MPNKKQKKVLVTGGAGFVGANIAKTLIDRGYAVTVFDNLSRGERKAVPKKAKFIKGDLRIFSQLAPAVKGMDIVIHCAAILVIPYSFKDPGTFFGVNVVGTLNLLEAMKVYKVKNLVFSSSAGVYAEESKSPIHEESRKFPYSPYGDSKLAMEHVMHAYFLATGINVTILRYFNPYGPGYFVDPPEHVIPVFFKKALNNEPFPVYGDGSMMRDYIYMDDLVEAHIKVMNRKGFNIYNVGGGKGVKIIDLVREIIDVTKSKSIIEHVPTPKGYPAKMYADISKIGKEVGWKPRVGLREGIRRTYEKFYKSGGK